MTTSSHAGEAARTPLQSLRSRWPVAVALGLVGLILGALLALATPTTYTAEARLAVKAGGLSTGALAGLPLASSQLASNYARYLNDQSLSGDDEVSASPIPDSNVIRVEAKATSEAAATAAAQQAASTLQKRVQDASGGSDADLLATYSAAAGKAAAALQSASEARARLAQLTAQDASEARLKRARQRVVTTTQAQATAELRKDGLATQYQNVVGGASSAELTKVRDASITASDRTGRIGRFAILGLVLGLAVAVVAVSLLERRGSRAR